MATRVFRMSLNEEVMLCVLLICSFPYDPLLALIASLTCSNQVGGVDSAVPGYP
jgi:hypothetical protein